MAIRRVPPPIAEVLGQAFGDAGARRALVAGAVALFAAAMDPRVWSVSLPSVQAAIRSRPELETVSLVGAVLSAALLLVGGAVGDTRRARPLILGGLSLEAAAAVVSLAVPDGPLFVASRFVGAAAASFIIPAALASVATAYAGAARATAIGLAYAAYGAAGAAAPILLQLLPGERWPALVAAVAACLLAIAIARPRIPRLPSPSTLERPYVASTALWAGGVVTVTTGVIWLGGWTDPARWSCIVLGLLAVGGAAAYDRRHPRTGGLHVDRRPIAVAIFAGVVLALAQTVPMLELPLYFRLVLRYGPFGSTIALAPLFVALIVAGPVAGMLLARYSPRTLVGAGVFAVGLGDLALAVFVEPGAGYVGFVIPCILVGAGFVIATTVRTAIIFASVPRGLPATAAALNEASISVGTRVGTVLVTAIVAEAALAAYTASLPSLPTAETDRLVGAFADLLAAVGTPSFQALAGNLDAGSVSAYAEAYASAVRLVLVLGAVVAIVGGLVAWLSLGRRDPLATVYEHRDERPETVPEPEPAGSARPA